MRRSRVALATALAAGAVAAGLTAGAPAQTTEATGPNIIVVMSDDQAPGMMAALPTVRRELGARGATFTNAIATYPLCCPARATLLTGEYAHNHGTLGNNPLSGGGYRALIDPERNLAAWLQAGGYDTAFAGKWLNGLRTPRQAPPGWDLWSGLVGEGGEALSSFYDYDVFEPDGTPRHYGDRPADYQTDVAHPRLRAALHRRAGGRTGAVLPLARLSPAALRGRAQRRRGPPLLRRPAGRALRASRARSRRPRYARSYLNARVPRPPARSTSATSPTSRSSSTAARRSRDRDLETIARDYRCGLAALRALDDGVGRDRRRSCGRPASWRTRCSSSSPIRG